MEEAAKGMSRTVLVFAANFSESLQKRITDPRHTNTWIVRNSDIEAHMDETGKKSLYL